MLEAGRTVIRFGTPLTPRESEALAEYVVHGGRSAGMEAADCLGITFNTLKNHLLHARARREADSTIDLLAKLGWLRVPVRTCSSGNGYLRTFNAC